MTTPSRPSSVPAAAKSASSSSSSSKSLSGYQLGDSLGKGAFGQVYRALNWETGETVAVKEIQLSNIPKGELPEIMSEIDLLKNLNHENIVKYKGFVKTREYLYIILEFCENGSLHNIIKKFGKFPENLVAVYISQVLEGLMYLHDQGVIHRDIKGANILTNKDGTVKLADFGVAARTGGAMDGAVVGSPYWMAPEVIEQSGATTASDIWSVGCVVIELLEGRPPYHNLDPMPALFRIVQDDCPPIPEGASPVVKDFLYHCFQKDCNLRISAKKLLKHPWMVATRRQMTGAANGRSDNEDVKENEARGTAKDGEQGKKSEVGTGARRTDGAGGTGRRPLSNYNYDEAVLKVQEWNEALKSPSRPTKTSSRHNQNRPSSPLQRHSEALPSSNSGISLSSHVPGSLAHSGWKGGLGMGNVIKGVGLGLAGSNAKGMPMMAVSSAKGMGIITGVSTGKQPLVEKIQIQPHFALQQPEEQTDNWDDDFEGGISFTKLQALEKPSPDEEKPDPHENEDNAQTIRPTKSPGIKPVPLAQPPAAAIAPIVEDYSDFIDDDEGWLEEKVADFKIKNPPRRGLFHPDDIKTVGLNNVEPAPLSAPPAPLNRKSSRPLLGPSANSTPSLPSAGPSLGSHGRSSSLSTPTSGSFGKAEAKKALQNQAEFGKYAENDDDEDYDDIFGKPNGSSATELPMQTLQLNTRLSNKSWQGDEDDEDPFAEIDEGFDEDDLEANLQRDKHARLCNTVNQLIDELTPSAPDFQLREACDQLLNIIIEAPEMQGQLVSSHGMLAILEVLEGRCSRDVIMKLLQIINLLVTEDVGFLESFCLIGGIPVMMEFTSKKYPSECRLEASNFIRLLCHTSVLTLQMFISCRGLKVLVDLLDEDYSEQTALVEHALNGIGSVFELQSPTTKNDFCRMFIREGLLDPLSAALLNVMSLSGGRESERRASRHRREGGAHRSRTRSASGGRRKAADDQWDWDDDGEVEEEEEEEEEGMGQNTKMKVIQILLVFCQVSQSDIHVRNALGTRKVVRRLLRACELLDPECLVQMLKAVKHLSMNATLHEVLQNANALEILIRILDEQSSGPHSTEMANHIFQTCYNLCRLSKSRQEEAAQAGILPCLKRVISTSSPLKQFALPILCDLSSAGKSVRTLLWQHGGLSLYIPLLDDPYFQVSAVESILSWLQDETSRVEDELLKKESVDALLRCFVGAKANSFENLLDPFLKILRLSHPVTIALTRSSAFFKRIVDRLEPGRSASSSTASASTSLHGQQNIKAVVRLNLLRILRYVCETHPNKAVLVERYGLLGVVERLSKSAGEGGVLVKELAREIIPVLRPALRPAPPSAGVGGSFISSVGSSTSTTSAHGREGRREDRHGHPEPRLKTRPPTTPTNHSFSSHALHHHSNSENVFGGPLATPSSVSKGLLPKRVVRRSASETSGVLSPSSSLSFAHGHTRSGDGASGIPQKPRASSRQRLGEIPWQQPPAGSGASGSSSSRPGSAGRW